MIVNREGQGICTLPMLRPCLLLFTVQRNSSLLSNCLSSLWLVVCSVVSAHSLLRPSRGQEAWQYPAPSRPHLIGEEFFIPLSSTFIFHSFPFWRKRSTHTCAYISASLKKKKEIKISHLQWFSPSFFFFDLSNKTFCISVKSSLFIYKILGFHILRLCLWFSFQELW